MARLIGPDESCRVVYLTSGTYRGQARAQGMSAPLYLDQALTTLADVLTTTGDVIAESTVTVDAYSRIPLVQYPDGVDTLYTSINGGPAVALYARVDDRLDSLGTRVTALEPGGGAEAATAADLAAHEADTTNIHGIADTSVLETTTGAQDKADAALTAAAALVDDLSGVGDPAAARTALELGDAATLDVGTTADTVAAGDDSRITGAAPRLDSPRETYRVLRERKPTLLVDRVFPNAYCDHRIVGIIGDNILYGIGHDDSLRTSPDNGMTWSQRLSNAGGSGSWARYGLFYRTASGKLIVSYHPYNGAAPKIQRSVDGGGSWADVVAAQTNVDYLGPTSICQDPVTGYIYLTEYVTVSAGTQATWKIMRSTDDGATWSTFHTFNRSGAGAVRHGHGIQWDPVGQRIWFITGDGEPDAGFYRVNSAGTDVEPVLLNSQAGGAGDRGTAVGLMFFPNYIAWGMDATSDSYLLRMNRNQIGQASPVVEEVARLQSTAFYCMRVASDNTEWLMSVSNQPGPVGTRLDNALHLYRVADDGATCDEVQSVGANSTTGYNWHQPVGDPLQTRTNGMVWIDCALPSVADKNTFKRGFQALVRLGWGNSSLHAKPDAHSKPYWLPATQSSGQVALTASQSLVFGALEVPRRATRLYILDMGVAKISGSGTPAVEVYNNTTGALVKMTGGVTDLQVQNVSRRTTQFEETAPYMYITDLLTTGNVLHLRLTELAAAACNATGYVQYAWGF